MLNNLTQKTKMKKIAFATSEKHRELTADDRLVIPYLAEKNIQVQPAVWTDESVDWQQFDAIIIRSCWDYHLKYDAFLNWIDQMEAANISLWNSAKLLRWNANKIYLQDLKSCGIPIVPTMWLENLNTINLREVMSDAGWPKAVLKPAVSASAHQTKVITPENAASETGRISAETQTGELWMLQQFMEEIVREGEWSLMFFGNQFSHAVLKKPLKGDFRVQQEFGGETLTKSPPRNLIQGASDVLNAVDADCLYARVDGIEKNGSFVLMELELIEPFLFLETDSLAAKNFAAAIQSLQSPQSAPG